MFCFGREAKVSMQLKSGKQSRYLGSTNAFQNCFLTESLIKEKQFETYARAFRKSSNACFRAMAGINDSKTPE